MLLALKVAILQQGKKQTRMAVDLGWDPAKLSRIVNELAVPTAADRKAIADYLSINERRLFSSAAVRSVPLKARHRPEARRSLNRERLEIA